MIDDVSAELEREQDRGDPTRLTYGMVVDDSPLTVTVGGSTSVVPARKMADYFPAVDDFVAILERGADRLVLGKVATSGRVRYAGAFSTVGSDDDILSGVPKQLYAGTETSDEHAMAVAGTSNVWTIPAGADGLFAVTAAVTVDTSDTGTGPQLSSTAGGKTYTAPGTLASGSYVLTYVARLAAGNTISFSIFQNGAGTRTISSSTVTIERLGS